MVNTSRHQRQFHLGASGVVSGVVSGVGSPERLPGYGQGGGPVLDAVKVAVGDGEEQSSTPFQGDSVGR